VRGKTIVTTTTNGTRALRACVGAQTTLVGSFLNLSAVVGWIEQTKPENLIVVCSGTFEQAAYEDVLAAGALLELLGPRLASARVSDTVHIACQIWRLAHANVLEAVKIARNARKLMSHPDLAADVPFCLQQDTVHLVAEMTKDGLVRRSAG